MSFHEIARAGETETILFLEQREEAARRLSAAEGLFRAVIGHDRAIFAEAAKDLENARAVASEWGLISIAEDLEREAETGRGLI